VDENRVAGLIGLAARARLNVYGEEGCVGLVRSGNAALVLIDKALSENGRKRYTDACRTKQVKMAVMKEELIARAVGKSGRMALAIEKGGLSDQLIALTGAEVPE